MTAVGDSRPDLELPRNEPEPRIRPGGGEVGTWIAVGVELLRRWGVRFPDEVDDVIWLGVGVLMEGGTPLPEESGGLRPDRLEEDEFCAEVEDEDDAVELTEATEERERLEVEVGMPATEFRESVRNLEPSLSQRELPPSEPRCEAIE